MIECEMCGSGDLELYVDADANNQPLFDDEWPGAGIRWLCCTCGNSWFIDDSQIKQCKRMLR